MDNYKTVKFCQKLNRECSKIPHIQQAVIIPGTVSELIEVIMAQVGYSEARIAEKIGASQRTIHKLRMSRVDRRNSKMTSRLIELYCGLVANNQTRRNYGSN